MMQRRLTPRQHSLSGEPANTQQPLAVAVPAAVAVVKAILLVIGAAAAAATDNNSEVSRVKT